MGGAVKKRSETKLDHIVLSLCASLWVGSDIDWVFQPSTGNSGVYGGKTDFKKILPFLVKYQSSDPRLSERSSLERERFNWEGEILGYTGGFSLEREMSCLGEKWHLGLVDTVRFSLERESLA
ncbi:hypothetical protein Lal_00033378 [Lupinus albus]|nr:hypothetical protein Lal_00033378 [Lupinus albus]